MPNQLNQTSTTGNKTLPKTNSSPLENGGWKTILSLLSKSIFQGRFG